MKHRIVIRCEAHSLSDFALKQQIAKCITAALDKQGVDTPCEINVLVTDDEGIRAINKAYRQIDKATDVLSFPMFELTPGKLPASWESYKDPDTGLVPLGDMAISLKRAKQQAAEFGHSARREVGYLTIHSILHLLGYDHVDEGPMKSRCAPPKRRSSPKSNCRDDGAESFYPPRCSHGCGVACRDPAQRMGRDVSWNLSGCMDRRI